jgi:phytanoyl-CoA hydroxylase
MFMRKLTQEELIRYREDGYIVVPDFFSKQELTDIYDEINRFEDSGQLPDKPSADHAGYIWELAMLSDKTKSFASDERILNLIEDLVYPGIAIYSSKVVSKLPNSDTVCHWHQDDSYYIQAGESDVRMSIWVPLTDATLDNGCLWVVPGSHKQGLQPYTRKNYGTCRLALAEEQVDFDLSKALPLEIEQGNMILFSAKLWHGSKGNQTNQIRRAFIVSYQEATLASGRGKERVTLRPAASDTMKLAANDSSY